MIQDTEHDLQARIRELEKHWLEVRNSEMRLEARIAKAKAILHKCNYNIMDDPNPSDALEALEGK